MISGRDPPVRSAQGRHRGGQQRLAWHLHGARRRSPSEDDEDQVVSIGCRGRCLREALASPRHRAAGRRPRSGRMRNCWRSCAALDTASTGRPSVAQIGLEPDIVQRSMHGVAGARMCQPQIEERCGGERRAAARQPDAGRGQAAKRVPYLMPG